jgi:hypothetical protein
LIIPEDPFLFIAILVAVVAGGHVALALAILKLARTFRLQLMRSSNLTSQATHAEAPSASMPSLAHEATKPKDQEVQPPVMPPMSAQVFTPEQFTVLVDTIKAEVLKDIQAKGKPKEKAKKATDEKQPDPQPETHPAAEQATASEPEKNESAQELSEEALVNWMFGERS